MLLIEPALDPIAGDTSEHEALEIAFARVERQAPGGELDALRCAGDGGGEHDLGGGEADLREHGPDLGRDRDGRAGGGGDRVGAPMRSRQSGGERRERAALTVDEAERLRDRA